MKHRQFKIPQLKLLHDRKRTDGSSQAGDDTLKGETAAEPAPSTGVDQDTRQIPQLEPVPPAGHVTPSPAERPGPRAGNAVSKAAFHTLDGEAFCELPCNEQAGLVIIGRGRNATVRIDDPYVHRVHAHLRWNADENAHVIAHGGGENSTYVNRRKVTAPVKLRDGARVRVGRTDLVYRLG